MLFIVITIYQQQHFNLLSFQLCADETLKGLSDEVELPVTTSRDNCETVTLMAIQSLEVYFTCPEKNCRPKKMNTVKIRDLYFMQCSQCHKQKKASNCSSYLVSRLIAIYPSGETKVLSIFKPEIEKLMDLKGQSLCSLIDKRKIEEQLLEILPADFSVAVNSGTVHCI